MTLRSRLGGAARRVLRPGPDAATTARLEHHDRALHDITAALQELQAWAEPARRARIGEVGDEVERVMPLLLETIGSAHGQQRAFARRLADVEHQLGWRSEDVSDLKRQVAELWERLESARAELLFELRYTTGNAPTPGATAPTRVTAEIVDPEAVEAARRDGAVRLNLGCGHVCLDDYLNVDLRHLPGVQVVAAVDDLPFGPGEVDELFSSHVIEHFPEPELARRLLPYWFGLLRPGGTFRAVLPDASAMLDAYAAGEIDFDTLREVTYGGQEYEGDFHFAWYSPATLTELLVAAGFEEVVIEASGRRNGKCLEMQLAARRPQ